MDIAATCQFSKLASLHILSALSPLEYMYEKCLSCFCNSFISFDETFEIDMPI